MNENETLDKTWVNAMEGVCIGRVSSRKRFMEKMHAQGPNTDRERWWLAKLVVMYRRQVRSDFAVATAQAYVAAHPEQDLRHKPARALAPEKPAPQPPRRNLNLFGEWT